MNGPVYSKVLALLITHNRLFLANMLFSVHSDVLVNDKETLAERGQGSEPSTAKGPNQTIANWLLKCTFPWRRAQAPPPPLPPFYLQGHSNTAGCSGNRVNVMLLHNMMPPPSLWPYRWNYSSHAITLWMERRTEVTTNENETSSDWK